MSAVRVSRLEVRELGQRIGERDLGIVRQVSELRLMSGDQIETVHFPPELHATTEAAARHCRRQLARLVDEQLLVRLSRRVGGLRAGSHAFTYALGPVGYRLLHAGDSRLRVYEPGQAFVDHQIAVSQLVVDLTVVSRRGELELLEVQGEPACWRTVPAIGRVVLRPDLFVALGVGDLEHRWFVEIDRGTHRSPALLRKAQLYESYYRSGVEQANHDVFPRVIWIAPDAARAGRIRKTLSTGSFSDGLMVATTHADALGALARGTI